MVRRTEEQFEKWWKMYSKQRDKFHKYDITYSGGTVGEYCAAKAAWFAVDHTPHVHPFKKVRTWDKTKANDYSGSRSEGRR